MKLHLPVTLFTTLMMMLCVLSAFGQFTFSKEPCSDGEDQYFTGNETGFLRQEL